MKGDGGDSLSPIKLTPINSNKRKEFRKKDIISRLDPKYLKYEKLIADEIRRRKSNTEKNSLELNNFINNKLMKASLLREKFYQKRRLNLKEKHDHIIDIYMKRKKAINISNQKNNILRSKIMLARLAKKNNIDNSIEKDSLISSDSSLFSSSDSLLSSSSNIDFNCLSENTILKENKTKENLNKNQDNNNSLSKNIEKNEIEINRKNKNINSHNNNNENTTTTTTTTTTNNNNNNNNNTVAVMSNGKEFDSNKENLSKNSIKSDIDDNSMTQNNANSNKDSKNIESTKSQESKINNSHHHHRHHHHRNGKNNHNKMKLNEISTDILDNISLYDTKLVIPYLPPVTRYTLRELDTDEIITNPQLRHDLYFDPKLQFKPNTDGERGVQKKMKADLCWKEIDYEINHLHNYKRIPLLINEIKCILKEMISYVKDFAEEIDSNIDIQLIAQEIKHGVFVPDNLISYIAKTLKVHCAPARDEYIDKIEELSKQNKFIETLKLIYEVLELMKLDLANHQLTRIRPYVLTHTVEFEWKFFKDQLEKKNISDVYTRNWLQMSLQNQPANSSFNSVFYAGFLKLLLTYNQNRIIPETFRLDKSRIVTFYNEWQDITILSCLLLIFRQACSSKCTSENVLNLKQRLYVLLTSQSTSLKHINLEITNMAGQIRKKEFSTKEIDLISGLVEKTLSPDSKLYVMIQTRISTYIVHFLNNDELPKELMYRHNMNEMEPEISTLSGKIKGVVELNLQTYSEYYKTIFLELKQQKTNSLIKTLNNAKNENNSLTKIQNQVSSSNGNKTSINNAPPSSSPSLSLSSEVTKMKLQVSHNSDIVVHNVSNNSQNNSHDSKSNSQI
ncbi:Tcp11-domain-containing protein [Neocallimastix sp. 'constans']